MILFHINFGSGIKMVTHVEKDWKGTTVHLLHNERCDIWTKVPDHLHVTPT